MIEWAVRDFLSLDLSFCCCDLTIYTQTLLVLLQRNETTDGLIFSAICQTERLLVSILCFLLFLRFSSSKCSGAHVNDSLRPPELKRNTERVLLHCKATPLSLFFSCSQKFCFECCLSLDKFLGRCSSSTVLLLYTCWRCLPPSISCRERVRDALGTF